MPGRRDGDHQLPRQFDLVSGPRGHERTGQPAAIQIGDEGFTGADRYLDGLYVFRKGPYIGGFANLKDGRDVSAFAKEFLAKIQ